ncbi:MAG: phosphotransferase family protein [Candidatus Zixiibacteriota bacterium]
MTRIGEEYGLSSQIYRVRWESDQAWQSAVIKLWDIYGPAGVREVLFFRAFGEKTGSKIPSCYYAAFDEKTRRGVLILEDIGDSGKCVQGDCLKTLAVEYALPLARSLAGIHTTWLEREELDSARWLPCVREWGRDADWIKLRGEEFLERFGDRLDSFGRSLLRNIERGMAVADECLAGGETTLLHGDLHMDNVLFVRDTKRPVILDWARASKGLPVIDLGELLFVSANLCDFERILECYLSEFEARSSIRLDDTSVRHELGGVVLRRFATWTCGVVRWKPKTPRETRMIDLSVKRALEATRFWRDHDPELFSFCE